MPSAKSSLTTTKAAGRKRNKKIALGKGLGALLPDLDPDDVDAPKSFVECEIDLIRPNRYQPRSHFDREELDQLSRSIRSQGIIQPLIVRKEETGYELIAGERRLRAAKLAGLNKVPVVIKAVSDAELLEMSLVENIQRANLNPIEEADAYHHLMTRFDMTQDQAAERVGKSRPAVANILRLRQLPDAIKASIVDGALSMGHARALLAADTPSLQAAAWRTVMAKGLSVRETERLVKRLNSERQSPPVDKPPDSTERYFSDLSESLSRRFGTKVNIKHRGEKGRVEFAFFSFDDLDRLLTLLK
jgi:ParB family chromosome partitioning protein